MAFGDIIVGTVLGGPSKPVDSNVSANGVFEGAPVNTTVGITASATSPGGGTVTYSLSADSSAGGFKINPVTGVVSVANPAKIDFESAPGHAYTITVLANNGRGVSSQTFTIGVNNVNEAPSGTNGTVVANEDTARVLTVADFGYSDVEGNALLSVKINGFSGTGTLTNNGVAVVAGSVISAADIAAGRLKYTPAANANGAAKASFTFQVRDNGGTANGGVDTDPTANTITINVNAVNDAPTATNLTQSLAIAEDAAATKLFTVAPAVADIDSATVTARLTLNAAAGVLVGAGAGVLNAGVLTYTITGTAAAVNAALAAVTYDSAQNFSGPTSVGITISDGGNGPQGVNPTGTVSITVGAINDAPTATNLVQSLTIAEDAAPTKLFTVAPVVADVDSGSVTATLIVNAAAGVLVGAGAGVLNAGAMFYTISGTPAAVSAALAAVAFDSAPDFSGATIVNVAITDGANGPQGTNPGGFVMVTVNAVNDAPTITAPVSQITGEDLTLELSVFNFNGISIADVDGGGAATHTVTLSVQHGILTLNGVAGLAFSVGDGVGDPTMTFTGTVANINAAISRLFYRGDANYNGPDGITITTNDNGNTGSGGAKTTTKTVALNVQAINDAPTATNLTQSLIIGEDAAATTLFTAAPVVGDIDSANVTATLTLSAAAGVLVGAGAGVLNAGVLTYTFTSTTAATLNAVLAAITFDSAADFNGATNVGVTISDGANGPQGVNPSGGVSITVNPINDVPVLNTAVSNTAFIEDSAPVAIAPALTLSDVDNPNLSGAIVIISGNWIGSEDVLAFTPIGNITGSYNPGSGVLTLSGIDTVANYELALRSVTYHNTNLATPSNAPRGIDYSVTDTDGGVSVAGATTFVQVDVTPHNDGPTLAATAGNPAYAPGVDLFSGVTASTVESGQSINQIVLTVSNVLDTDESLTIDGTSVALVDGTVSVVPTATLGVNYSVAVSGNTATITITGSLTGAQTGTLIDGLGFTNTTVSPGDLPRTVTIVSLTDDGGTAFGGVATATPGIASTVNFNIPPTVDVDGVVNYTENDAATFVDQTITITDTDDTHMESATVVISSGFAAGQDVLTFTNTANITGSFVGNTLTATGHATLAEYETFLESVRYQNTSEDPSTADRILSYSVNDGFVNSALDTATIHVAARNDEPTLTATGNNPTFTENGAAVDLFSSPAASTVEAGQTFTHLVIDINNVSGNFAGDFLTIDGTDIPLVTSANVPTALNNLNVSVSVVGAVATVTVISLTGLSNAAMSTVIDNLAFGSTSEDPANANRVVTITTLTDNGADGGGNDSTNSTLAVSSTVTVTPVNDEPTLTTTGLNPGFTENSAAVDLFSTPVVASAIESAQNLNFLVVTVSNVAGTGATESLTIDGTVVELNNGNSEVTAGNAMTASVVLAGGTATVTISKAGGVSAAAMQTIVDALAYGNTSDDPGAATRVVTITSLSDTGPTGGANDNTVAPNIASSVAVTPANDAPVIDLVAGGGIDNTATTATFSEGAGPPVAAVNVLANIDLIDPDNANLIGATVTLTDMVGGQDVLTVSGSTSGSIGGVNYTVSSNVVTFFGTNSVAAYEAAIQAVEYNNSSENPGPATRHFDVQVTDGASPSTTATATVIVAAQDDPPVNTIPTDAVVPTAFSNTDTAISGISIADVDAGSGFVTTQLLVTNGTVAVSLAGVTTIIAGANGTATLTLSGTVADINATLANNVTFHSTDGFTGQANLTVATNDGGNTGAGGPHTDTDVVHIGVVPQVWYIDNTNFAANGAGGTGTEADPFRSIADFNAAAGTGTNDYVVIRTGTGTYTGDGLNLKDGQLVYGAGETLSFTNPVNGNVVQILDGTGTRPTINVTTNGDQGIDLASGNTIHGVNITTGAGTTGLDDGNNSVGTLVVSDMSISGAGQAVDIDQGGNLNVVLESVSSTGGAFGVQLAGTAAAGAGLLQGSFSAAAGAISGSTTSGFLVGNGAGGASTGGTAAISYAGTVTASNAASVINVQDHSTGAVTFSGNLTKNGTSGAGIVLDDNSSNFTFSGASLNLNTGTSTAINITDQTTSTVLFSGATLNIDTTTGAGVNIGGTNTNGNFNFTGGTMTIDSTGAGNSFAATGGGTVNITGANNHIATVGGTALSINNTTIGASDLNFKDISANGGANGIVLIDTGSSGGLTVTGTGTTDGSGGTIANASGHGIILSNTRDVSISNMNVSGSGNDGINGLGVNGFSLANVNITNNGNAVSDRGIDMVQLSGSGGISNSTISGSAETNVRIENDSANLTAFNVTGTTIATTNFTTGDDGFLVLNTGSANMTVSVTGSTFTDNKGDHFQAASDADATGTMNITFNNNTLTTTAANDPNVIGGGITINTSGTLDIVYQLNNNNIQEAFDDAININLDPGSLAGASMTGTISGNTIGTSGVASSGSESSNTITIAAKGQGLMDVDVTNNNIFEWSNAYGIFVGTTEGDADVVAKVTGNTLHATQSAPGTFNLNGIRVDAGATAGDAGVLEIVLTGNDVTGEGTVAAGDADIRLRQRFDTTIKLPGYGGANNDTAAVNAFVAANNDPTGATPAPSVSSVHNVGAGGQGFIGGVATPLLAAGGGVAALTPTSGEMHLSQAQLDTAVDAAIAQWAHAGASAAQLAKLSAITFTVADLAGNTIGDHSAGHIAIDDNAAGHGWFVDTTPWDNFEFAFAENAAGTDLSAAPSSAAAGHLDLLTAVMHEMGHELGLDHAADAHALMFDSLVDGERRLPTTADVAQADGTEIFSFTSIFSSTPTGVAHVGAAADGTEIFSFTNIFSSTPTGVANVGAAADAEDPLGSVPNDPRLYLATHSDLHV